MSGEAITGEPAYPYLQVSGNLGPVENLTKAYAKCQALSSGNVTWRLPRISELYWLYKYNDTYLKAPDSSYFCIISGTKYSSNEIWGIGPSDSYALNRGELYKDSKNTFWNVRCVREIRPYNITIEESK